MTGSKVRLVTFDLGVSILQSPLATLLRWPINSLHRVEIAFAGVDISTALQLVDKRTRSGPLQLNSFWTAKAEACALLKLLQKAELQIPAVVALSDLIERIDDAVIALFTTAQDPPQLVVGPRKCNNPVELLA